MIEDLADPRRRYPWLLIQAMADRHPVEVVIPHIRHVVPKLIAFDLCSVQPMTAISLLKDSDD